MKLGFRIPSLTKQITARISVKRIIGHNLRFIAPRGMGWMTDPKKKVYNKTSTGYLVSLVFLHSSQVAVVIFVWKICVS
jgi:hypothetical protein